MWSVCVIHVDRTTNAPCRSEHSYSVTRSFCNALGPCLSVDVSDPHYSLQKGQKARLSFNLRCKQLRLVGF